MSPNGKCTETETRLEFAKGWRESIVTVNDCNISFQSDEMFKNEIVVMVVELCKYTKTHWIKHLKWINFMEYALYLNRTL